MTLLTDFCPCLGVATTAGTLEGRRRQFPHIANGPMPLAGSDAYFPADLSQNNSLQQHQAASCTSCPR
jgi:hypothetical protein